MSSNDSSVVPHVQPAVNYLAGGYFLFFWRI